MSPETKIEAAVILFVWVVVIVLLIRAGQNTVPADVAVTETDEPLGIGA